MRVGSRSGTGLVSAVMDVEMATRRRGTELTLSKCPWASDIKILGVNQCRETVPGKTRREKTRWSARRVAALKTRLGNDSETELLFAAAFGTGVWPLQRHLVIIH